MWPASPPHLNSGYPSSSVDPALLNSLACPTAARLDFLNRNTYALLVSAGKEYGPMDATMPSRWMTLQEVAEYLQLSKDMIYRLAQSGGHLRSASISWEGIRSNGYHYAE